MLITFMKFCETIKNNSISNTKKWCIINRLNYSVLYEVYELSKQLIENISNSNIPILSYNTHIDKYTIEMKTNILKALFCGLYLNRAKVSKNNIKYFYVQNWYGKNYYAETYKGSSFYTGNYRIANLYPKDIFYGSMIMKNRNGMYVNYITGGISPYNPEWIGTIVPKI